MGTPISYIGPSTNFGGCGCGKYAVDAVFGKTVGGDLTVLPVSHCLRIMSVWRKILHITVTTFISFRKLV